MPTTTVANLFSVTIQDNTALDCLLHTLHNTYTACKIVESLSKKGTLNRESFEGELETNSGFTFQSRNVQAFRRDINTLAMQLQAIAFQKKQGKLSRRPLQKLDGNAKKIHIPPQNPTADKEENTPESLPSKKRLHFRAQNDQSRSAQKAQKSVAIAAIKERKNNSNKRKREKKERPKSVPQQLDDRMRRQLESSVRKFGNVMDMTTPLTKSDDFPALVEDLDLFQRRQSAEESQWPDTIPGMILYTQQVPNNSGSAAVRPMDCFLKKATLTLLVPSKQQGDKLLEKIRNQEISVNMVTSGSDFMNVTQQPKVARSMEPNKPRDLSKICSKIGATDLMKSGRKNADSP
jgi:hypothetical protein